MTITNFKEDYSLYENMEIWEIKSIAEFLKTHEKLTEIFSEEYDFSYEESHQQEEFRDSDLAIVSKLLNYFDDKYFFVFSYNDTHHEELKKLQDRNIINFGMDIYRLHPEKIYVLEMDRTKDIRMYDR